LDLRIGVSPDAVEISTPSRLEDFVAHTQEIRVCRCLIHEVELRWDISRACGRLRQQHKMHGN
jgi:hypothetical protein